MSRERAEAAAQATERTAIARAKARLHAGSPDTALALLIGAQSVAAATRTGAL